MKRVLVIKILIVSLCILLASGVFLVILAFNQYNAIKIDPAKILSQNKQPSMQTQSLNSAEPSQTLKLKKININGKEYTEKPDMVNILFCGVDYMSSRADRNLGERSDMIMVCAVDIPNKKVTLISIPRDTRALVDKIDIKTGKATDKEYNKINAAFAFGGGTDRYSYQNTINCVKSLLNVDSQFNITINYYTGLNIDGIPHLANTLGGVSVKLQEDFPGIGNKGATVNLKGQKAIDFVRERHAFSNSDLARTQHQQQFMISMAKKIQNMGAADSILKLYDQVTKYIDTNMNTDEMLALALVLDKVNIDSVEHITVPGKWESPFIWPDTAEMTQTILNTYYQAADGF